MLALVLREVKEQSAALALVLFVEANEDGVSVELSMLLPGNCPRLVSFLISMTPLLALSGCTDNFCFGCTSPGEAVPMKPALSIMRYRIFDPASQRVYASGCDVARTSHGYHVSVAVPLNVEYAADIYHEIVASNDADAGGDTRSTEQICSDSHVFYTNGLELVPWCLQGYTNTTLVDVYAIDMSGARVDMPTETTLGGARYVAKATEYGPAEFLASGDGCPSWYTFDFWNVVASK